jgi:RHH-type rel operon transcriptional repressor/antitoxin RelB
LDENEDYLLAKDALEEFLQSDDDAIDLADVEWP